MSEKGTILTGERALELWLRGREAWNAWVKNNPEANIDFIDVDFGDLRAAGETPVGMKEHEWPFAGFRFPDGEVSFNKARFGDGRVSFGGAQFGNGDVSFTEAQFGEGVVSFSVAEFGDGEVSFRGAQFGDGGVSFREAEFGEGDVSFIYAQFGDGRVSFEKAQFGKGDVNFARARFGDGGVYFDEAQFGNERVSFSFAKFGEGVVSFDETQFGEGDVFFTGAQFGDGAVSFIQAQFGNGKVSFDETQFGEGDVFFTGAQFGDGAVSFEKAQFGDGRVSFDGARFGEGDLTFTHSVFGGRAIFSNLRNAAQLTGLSFLYATFNKDFILSIHKNLPLGCVPDLRGCQFNHHLVLDRIRCKPRDVRKSEDASRLCRLKEIAEGNKDHDSALHFNARQLQTQELPPFHLLLEQLYGALSDYGRSIGRPLICLGVLWFFCGLGYLAYGIASGGEHSWITPFVFSLKQMFPLLPVLRDLGLEGQNIPEIVKIAREGSNALMLALIFFQNIASLVLLFLLGLGLRNRFRV